MKSLWVLATVVYVVIVGAALDPLSAGGEPRAWALSGIAAPGAAMAMASRQEGHWQAVTVGTGLFVGAFMVLNGFAAS